MAPIKLERFAFGRNWARFLNHLTAARVASSERSLVSLLGAGALKGERFLDVGCGSGLFSLAARRVGARVTSFDCDPHSVACAERLRRTFAPDDSDWQIVQGSVLDREFLGRLGSFDVVYAWGVLHHTGAMWKAIENVMASTRPGGTLVLALYNDQGWLSHYWGFVKRLYNRAPWLRAALVTVYAPYYVGLRWLVHLLRRGHRDDRGMSLWYDLIDWLGGFPFEVARPTQVVEFASAREFRLLDGAVTVGRRHGCNQFVFVRKGGRDTDAARATATRGVT